MRNTATRPAGVLKAESQTRPRCPAEVSASCPPDPAGSALVRPGGAAMSIPGSPAALLSGDFACRAQRRPLCISWPASSWKLVARSLEASSGHGDTLARLPQPGAALGGHGLQKVNRPKLLHRAALRGIAEEQLHPFQTIPVELVIDVLGEVVLYFGGRELQPSRPLARCLLQGRRPQPMIAGDLENPRQIQSGLHLRQGGLAHR